MPDRFYTQADFSVLESKVELLLETKRVLHDKISALEQMCDVYSAHAKTLAGHEERIVRLETDITEAVELARETLDKTTYVLTMVKTLKTHWQVRDDPTSAH